MAPCRLLSCLAIVLLLISSLVGCGPSKEQLRREAEDTRKLGEAYLRAGNPTAALKEFFKAEAHDADNYILQNDLGLAYLEKNRIDLAIPHFKKAIELKPDFAPGKNNLGNAYLRDGQYDEAIKVLTEVSEDLIYATPHFPLTSLGAAYYNKREFDLAEKYYLKALEINPRYPNAQLGLGRTQIAMGNVDDGIKTLERAVQQSPNFIDAWFDLGLAYRQNGENEKALSAFEKVVSLAPDSPLAESATEQIATLKQ